MIFTETKLPGAFIIKPTVFPDERGFFREVVRHNDPIFENKSSLFAQWSHSKMARNTVKAWHYHHLQIDWWYIGMGVAHVVLYDLREESPTYKRKMEFKLGDSDLDREALTTLMKIPQGVLHGCKVLSDFAHLFYITSETYSPDDEGRYPFNSDVVPHNWGTAEELIVAANDKKVIPPKNPRRRM